MNKKDNSNGNFKIIAIIIAIVLAVTIVSLMLFTAQTITDVLCSNKKTNNTTHVNNKIEKTQEQVPKNLEIKLYSGNVEIVEGEKFSFETNVPEIETKVDGDRLSIVDNRKRSTFGSGVIKIFLPKNKTFKNASVEAGAGNFKLTGLKCEKLDLKVGAGNMSAENLKVTESANIESGAGKTTFSDCNIKNPSISMGAGYFEYDGKLYGKINIDHGLGKAIFDIDGKKSDYAIQTDSGLGTMKIDGEPLSDDLINKFNPKADNKILIESGIGKIELDFNE